MTYRRNVKYNCIDNIRQGGNDMGNIKESKREKFVRLAEARTNKIIDMIQLLGNCSNQSQYEYTQKDVNKIFNAIQTELDMARKRYSKQDSQKGKKFKLD